MITAREYRKGDIALVPVAEADPFDGYAEHAEARFAGLTSYDLNGELVAVTYYSPMWDGVADAAALVNRELAFGHGLELAKVIRSRIDVLMRENRLHRVQATADPADTASQVFLRAMGYRYESTMQAGAPDGSDLMLFVIIKRV